jgi:hypothetical protein
LPHMNVSMHEKPIIATPIVCYASPLQTCQLLCIIPKE